MSSSGDLHRGVRIALLLAPAVSVVGVLFVGGLGLGLFQSLGYQPYLPHWHWNLDAYTALWHDPAVRDSLPLTLRVGLLSTLLATVLGVAVALLVHHLDQGRSVVTGLLSSTLAVPHLVGALTMLLLLGQSGLLSRLSHALGLTATPAAFPALTADGAGWGIVAEYTWRETPFIAVVVLAALASGVDELHAAARTLRAGPWQRFRHVTAPLITPAVTGSSLLVLAFTVGSYEVPAVLGRPYPAALPVVALQYQQDVDLHARPRALALATLLALLVTVVGIAYTTLLPRLVRRSAR
jgi:putative spermidine/putrescine transport system permease protein